MKKIQHWEFIDLTSLLSWEPSTLKSDTVTLSHEGRQILVVDPQSQPSRRKKQTVDLLTLGSVYVAEEITH